MDQRTPLKPAGAAGVLSVPGRVVPGNTGDRVQLKEVGVARFCCSFPGKSQSDPLPTGAQLLDAK